MAVPRTLGDLRRLAERGDEGAAFLLARAHISKGRPSKALKALAPLAKAGNRRAIGQFIDLTVSLARTDARYQPPAEALLRREGHLLRLAREMRSWTGRGEDARELLVTLAVEKSVPAAALDLAGMDHDDPQASAQWHCLAIELGATSWHKLQELLSALPQDADGAAKLRDRARRAVRTAQQAEKDREAREREAREAREATSTRSPDPVAIDLGDAAAIVGTAAVIPLVQAVATQAGGDVYKWVRQLFGRAVGRESEELTERATEAALYVVGDNTANTWLEMRGRPTDEALAKLAETDLETLAAPDRRGRAVIVRWVPEAGEWQRRLE
ncbi:hypothetical protein F7R91_25205 [Streptomyces luteolifulvus]|uniref:Uncharacterized protein n=1 Tax=Streptomyces luteolifulvus TaxID=2615112 RepID=A0A6H9UWX6_9ACTN|nr:hypothetical protein [Streptomyces luteolifulvus]KAB1143471.1 hypothetical protein F7R91_25205 [Streptomyces luteolifulvus]